MPNQDNIAIYDANAATLADQYERVTSEETLPVLARIFTQDRKLTGNALDIGSGSGRDAFWLASNGWAVDSIDGSKALLAEASKRHPHENIDYYYDRAPDFTATINKGKSYDLILMAAFLFHFDTDDRMSVLKNCLSLLSQDGLMHLSLRSGPLMEGRNIFLVDVKEIEDFAQNHGLSAKYHGRSEDSAGRANIAWDYVSVWRGKQWAQAAEMKI